MTDPENITLVPDPDFCVVLAGHHYPQDRAKFYWVTSGITTVKGDEIWLLLSADELEANGVEPWTANCFAAPVVEEFMRICPPQYFVTWARFAFIFVDILKSVIGKEGLEGDKKTVMTTFFRIKDADAPTAANCFAKGICFLLINKQLGFKKPEPKIVEAKS